MRKYRITFTDGTTEDIKADWHESKDGVISFNSYDPDDLETGYLPEVVLAIYPILNIKSVHIKEGKDA